MTSSGTLRLTEQLIVDFHSWCREVSDVDADAKDDIRRLLRCIRAQQSGSQDYDAEIVLDMVHTLKCFTMESPVSKTHQKLPAELPPITRRASRNVGE